MAVVVATVEEEVMAEVGETVAVEEEVTDVVEGTGEVEVLVEVRVVEDNPVSKLLVLAVTES